MFVKKIEIFGFKTFAERTEIDLSKGLTAIVGPNGCGKTNIIDALTWVLGESNVRNIRAQKTVDVIFNGTEKRKPLGLAEVSITFDNTCSTLPISFGEVTITRRAYRSGESEFFINKSACRLKDIYELFLDTGIGREAYSSVSQGEIDAVLSAKPEDRRELLEEAAGVKKYRYRRHEALKKLGKTETHLYRVTDIMAEIEGQLDPIAEQAKQAKRYLTLEKQLQEVEVGLLIRDLHRLRSQLETSLQVKSDTQDVLENCSIELEKIEGERAVHAESLGKIEEGVEENRRAEQTLGVNVQKLEGHIALLQEKLRAATSIGERAEADIESLTGRAAEIRQRIETTQAEGANVLGAESKADEDVKQAVAQLDAVSEKIQTQQNYVEQSKASYLELARELAAKRTSLQNCADRVKQFEESAKRTGAQMESLEQQKSEAQKQYDADAAEIDRLNRDIEQYSEHIRSLTESRNQLENQLSALTKQLSDLSRDIASRSSRLAALSEMAESHEGFYEGVRSVMNAGKRGVLKGNFAVVADIIRVPKGYEVAIETALGASLQDIVADTFEQAKAAIAYLKRERAGRATFLPLDNIRQDSRGVQMGRSSPEGVLGVASQLLSYDPHFAKAIESLLGRCVVVENIDNAVHASRKLSGWNRIVTLEGDLISPSGAVTGGAIKSKGPGLLVRKSEMESLEIEVTDAKKRMTKSQAAAEELRAQIAQTSDEIKKMQSASDACRISLTDRKRRRQYSESEMAKLVRELKALELEVAEADRLRKEQKKRMQELEGELEEAGDANLGIDRAVSEAQQQISALEEERSKLRERVLELNVGLASVAQRSLSIKNSLKESEIALNQIENDVKLRRNELQNAKKDLQELGQEEALTKEEHRRQSELLANARRNLSEIVAKRTQESDMAAEMESAVKKLMLSKTEASNALHEAELRLARLDVQSGQILQRLLDEYEIDADRAYNWPVEDIGVERGVASEVARIRREMRDMGQVNIGAIQEHERITERWDFLSTQRADLEEAQDQIQAAIREIDINTRDLFVNTFALVAANFDLMFKQLFNGGKTELFLTDPNNLLDTGIEISVQPPGKKLQDMSLLSGGERSLTATAFIFALLLAKPSPFVVMDEVDASLDESNVERFAQVLKQFAERSQFIVITHNRSTMEASDYLYGVTMQEPGISKLISVRLSGEGAGEPEPASTI